jgi:hypothetical protein
LRINPLPKEIVSWLTNLLQNQPKKEQWSKPLTRSKLSLGIDSNTTSNQLGYMTHSCHPSPENNSTRSWELSAKQSERVDLILDKTNLVNLNQLELPWIMWHRPTAWPTNLIQDSTQMESLRSSYNANLEVTKTSAHPVTNK